METETVFPTVENVEEVSAKPVKIEKVVPNDEEVAPVVQT